MDSAPTLGSTDTAFVDLYEQLRTLARQLLLGERTDHSLQPTALVHEGYLRLIGQRSQQWSNERQFMCMAATMFRRILVNYARARNASKRGGGQRFAMRISDVVLDGGQDKIADIDTLVDRLARLDSDLAAVINMRVFCGLSVKETARVLQRSPRWVQNKLAFARAWLRRELETAT